MGALLPETGSSAIQAAFAALCPSGPGRVLVIDESPALRRFILTQLSGLTCSVVATGDGLTGLELGLKATFDIVVVTESLDGLGGLAICRILSVLPPERRPLIIFHAAGSLSGRQARSAGADLLLSQDAEGEGLVAWIRVYLASHPARKSRGTHTRRTHPTSIAALATSPCRVEDPAWADSGIV